jgi:hypothetical protein
MALQFVQWALGKGLGRKFPRILIPILLPLLAKYIKLIAVRIVSRKR